ncbi:MAG: hypothetical protein KDA27_19180 [Candidatus Eisenbacteria bacterium]|uniref:Uncharacterized protein n=1 Tax=Eiseniibacteriota bacterium TaxID=2212470 RepID=A0A956NHM0_UNCEI|nr:hypothetical protein [Candidatus Eisenbacteria bacterium]
MPAPRSTMSADRLLDPIGTYLILQMENDPLTVEIRPSFRGDQDKLSFANENWKDALHQELVARSARNWELPKLRNTVRALANTLVEMGNGSRKTVLYRSYFPQGFAAVSKKNLEEQIVAVKSILIGLEKETDPRLVEARESLAQAVVAAETIDQAWQVSRVSVAERKDELDRAKLVWIAAYRRVEGELRAIYSDNLAMVSVFFLSRSKRKTADAPVNGTAPAVMEVEPVA